MQKPLVIYHKDCADGLAAAWCFWKQYKDSFDYYPGVYNVPPPDVFDRDVYMVDFSYKHDVMEMICKYANKVVLLDHHKSALDDLWDLAALPNFSMDYATDSMSGAMIAWQYVKDTSGHKRKLPELLKHIQDRDLWKFELPHTREIMSAVFSYEKSMTEYDKLMKLTKVGIKDLVKEGKIIERKYQMDLCGLIAQCKRHIEFEGYNVPIANLNGLYASDAGSVMSEGYPFSMTYYDTENHRVFSLRSKPTGIDVSEIAAKYNGGGHKHAAGFKVVRSHALSKI